MAKYITDDGRMFDLESDAKKHANTLAANDQIHRDRASAAKQRTFETYKQLLKDYNSNNWDAVIKNASLANCNNDYPSADIMEIIAQVNKDNDYEAAFFAFFGKTYFNTQKNYGDPNYEICEKDLENTAKKLWEKAQGRIMMDADLQRIHIEILEKIIAWRIEKKYMASWISPDVNKWEKLTGKKMTKQEQIRINGKPFPEGIIKNSGGFFGGLFGKK